MHDMGAGHSREGGDVRGLLCMKELKGIQRLLTVLFALYGSVLFALYGSILSPPLHHRYT